MTDTSTESTSTTDTLAILRSLVPCVRRGGAPDEIHYAVAADGWRLAMHRYRPRDSEASGEPVMLLHGLGSNHVMFDLGVVDDEDPVPSLARWLREQGYDVWSCDLRGSGASVRPGRDRGYRWDWSVDDFIHLDTPAFIDTILRVTGRDQLHWLGHSLGGILMLCHGCLHGSPKVASGIVIAGGLDYSDTPTNYKFIEPLKGIGRYLKRVPSGLLSRAMAPVVGRFNNGIESFNTYPGSTARAAQRAIYRDTVHDVSGEALYQLSSLFSPGGLRSLDGRTTYSNLADRITTPVLLMGGDRDLQCSHEVPGKMAQRLAGDAHQVKLFGTCHGHTRHYGHFDLVCGIDAEEDVFPHIGEWLGQHPVAVEREEERAEESA